MAYNTLQKAQLINAVSMGATITSAAQRVVTQDNIGIQLIWTGTPVGTFSVQVSVDHQQPPQDDYTIAGTWTNLPLSAVITASGSGDNAYVDLNQLSAPYYRIVYTRTSGTGTLNAYVTQKGV